MLDYMKVYGTHNAKKIGEYKHLRQEIFIFKEKNQGKLDITK